LKSVGGLPAKGIRGSQIYRLTQDALIALYSQIEKSEISAENFQQAALEFHDVVHAVFGHAAVIPFRFPTWLTEPELGAHIGKESKRYQDFLTQHADHVQMEVRIALTSGEASAGTASGTEHLRQP